MISTFFIIIILHTWNSFFCFSSCHVDLIHLHDPMFTIIYPTKKRFCDRCYKKRNFLLRMRLLFNLFLNNRFKLIRNVHKTLLLFAQAFLLVRRWLSDKTRRYIGDFYIIFSSYLYHSLTFVKFCTDVFDIQIFAVCEYIILHVFT